MIIAKKELCADFIVVGGGMAGLCAAVAAARNGAKTVIIQDRPMFGGNASSEIRMWVCGAHGENRKETGLLEELQLDNCYFNPGLKFTIWDDVMYSFARAEKNLTVLLNSSVESVETENGSIVSVTAWNLIEYARYVVKGRFFADCSGDGILRLSGARYRWGRESRDEFDESHAPVAADRKTMGNSILMQLRRTDTHRPFRAPAWAYHYTDENVPPRNFQPGGCNNFWWLEFGGVKDTITDGDAIRDELYKMAYGVWAYMKNHPDGRARDWELDWIGSLPGKRENVRFVGDHVLCQKEVEAGGKFPDVVCYGGWTMDDHHPEAFYYQGAPTIFHPAPSPFGIPYRCLYSANIDNLFFAGRQISTTHMALSSTRVMATTATMGQAIGTAAALAVRFDSSPRGIYLDHLAELQQTLMDQDQFLPGFVRQRNALTLRAIPSHAELRDEFDRDWDDGAHGVALKPGESCGYSFAVPEMVGQLRIVFDSDLSDLKRQRNVEAQGDRAMPECLTRDFKVELKLPDGSWKTVARENDNHHRLVHVAWPAESCSEVRLTIESGWGNLPSRIFSLDLA